MICEATISRGQLPDWTMADFSGYGYGDGYGSGYGYGYGDGDGALSAYLSHPLVAAAVEAGETVSLGWWRSGTDGQSANGGRTMADPARPGLIQEVPGPLRLCSQHALHASWVPSQWDGERWWVVGLLGETRTDGSKAGALRRLIVEEVA